MHHPSALFLVICLLVICLSRTEATDYYVSPTGSDTNTGLGEASAWRTIAHAAQNVHSGDTVRIKGGSYNGDHLLVEKTALKDRPIVFQGYDGTPVLTNGSGKGIHVLNSQHIHIKNITVAYCSDNGVKLQNSHYCKLDNVIVRDCHKRGQVFYIRDSDHNTVQNCRIHQTTVNADYYLVLVYSNHNTVRDCLSEHAVGFDVSHQTHGIGIKDYSSDRSDSAYHSHHNTFINCVAVNHGECFYAARPCHDNEFIKFLADNSGGKQSFNPCFQVRDGAYDNTFRNCRGKGTKVGLCVYDYREKDNTGCEYQTQRNNRFVNCILEGARADMIGVFLRRSENTLLQNCVFQNCEYLFRFGRDGETGGTDSVVGTEMRNCIVIGSRDECDGRRLGEPYSHSKGETSYKWDVKVTYCDFHGNGFRLPSGIGNIGAQTRFWTGPIIWRQVHLA